MKKVERVTSAYLCDRLGLSYRMLDYYARLGLNPGRGSGRARKWTREQAETLEKIVALQSSVRRARQEISSLLQGGSA